MTTEKYVELYCTYCDSQRCMKYVGSTIEEKCPYWEERKDLEVKPVNKGTSADCPTIARPFDWTPCEKCLLTKTCKHKEGRSGCNFGVEYDKENNV